MRHLRTFESADRLYFLISGTEWIRMSPRSSMIDYRTPFWSDGLSKNILVSPVVPHVQNEAMAPILSLRYYELVAEAINIGPGGPDRIEIVFGKDQETNRTAFLARLLTPTTEQVSGLIAESGIQVYKMSISYRGLMVILYFIVDDWAMLRVVGTGLGSEARHRMFRCDGIAGVKQCLEDLKTTITQ